MHARSTAPAARFFADGPDMGNTHAIPSYPMRTTSPPLACTARTACASNVDSAPETICARSSSVVSASSLSNARCISSRNPPKETTTVAASNSTPALR